MIDEENEGKCSQCAILGRSTFNIKVACQSCPTKECYSCLKAEKKVGPNY